MLFNGSPGAAFDAIRAQFVEDFTRLGRVDGRDIAIEPRFAEGQLGRLPALAADLIAQAVDVIVTLGGPASVAERRPPRPGLEADLLVQDPGQLPGDAGDHETPPADRRSW